MGGGSRWDKGDRKRVGDLEKKGRDGTRPKRAKEGKGEAKKGVQFSTPIDPIYPKIPVKNKSSVGKIQFSPVDPKSKVPKFSSVPVKNESSVGKVQFSPIYPKSKVPVQLVKFSSVPVKNESSIGKVQFSPIDPIDPSPIFEKVPVQFSLYLKSTNANSFLYILTSPCYSQH